MKLGRFSLRMTGVVHLRLTFLFDYYPQAYAASSDPPKYTLLTYDYVPDILEKRGPYRADHLAAAFRKVLHSR